VQTVGVSVIAAPIINPTTAGAPRPVQMRLYQLRDDVKLQNAEFVEIWKQDREKLGKDLIKVDEFPVYPDTRTELRFDRDPGASTVAGVALFREPKGKSWMVSFQLPPPPGKVPCEKPACDGDSCPGPGDLRFYFYIENMRIEDGAQHADDVPQGGEVRILRLSPGAKSPPPAAEEPP
jgi:type VI secretion system protein VasD